MRSGGATKKAAVFLSAAAADPPTATLSFAHGQTCKISARFSGLRTEIFQTIILRSSLRELSLISVIFEAVCTEMAKHFLP